MSEKKKVTMEEIIARSVQIANENLAQGMFSFDGSPLVWFDESVKFTREDFDKIINLKRKADGSFGVQGKIEEGEKK